MKNLLMVIALVAGIHPAIAADVTITVPDTFKATITQTQVAFERCLGATVAHLNTDNCAVVVSVLSQLANLPSTPLPVPSASPTPSPSPTP